MPIKTTKYDAAEYLETAEDVVAYIEAAFEDGNPAIIKNALGVVARARGMTAIAREAGVTREALYKALSENGDPRLSTLVGVLNAIGMRLSAKAAAE